MSICLRGTILGIRVFPLDAQISLQVYGSVNYFDKKITFIVVVYSFAEGTTYYVSSYKGKDFRISTQPFDHSLYSEEFRFTLEHPRGYPKEKPFFVYPGAFSRQTFVSSKLDLSNYTNFPIDVVVLSNREPPHNSRKIYVIDRSTYGPMISLDDHKTVNCCKGKLNFSFYAHNITESGKIPRKHLVSFVYMFYVGLTVSWNKVMLIPNAVRFVQRS